MSTEPTSEDDPLKLAGTRVGPYAVLHLASVGGFAAIYRAEHESLHFAVALKVLMPEVVPEHARATLEECFLREAQILGQLRSVHVLRAHHHGKVACPVDGQERSYIVVDWLDGQELSHAIEDRLERAEPYDIGEVMQLLEPIALALDAVHAQGLVHRDVNSRNIFLVDAKDGGMPQAMLIDFGFAKQAEQSVSGLQIQESTNTLMAGSPDFSAPEHFDRQRFGEPSPRTDLYTFALTLVHALTLEPPLSGDSPRELYEATLNVRERPTPNRRGANLSPEVDALFALALAVEPKQRPEGLLAWWNELKATAIGGAPSMRPPPPLDAAPFPAAHAASSPATHAAAAPRADPIEVDDAAPSHIPPEAQPHAGSGEPIASQHPPKRRSRKFLPILVVSVFILGGLGLVAAAKMGISWQSRPECGPGFADCNQLPDDGCEANLEESALHCGACGSVCSSAKVEGICQAGECRVRKCQDTKRRDCNAEFADGCETDVSSDPQHCGDCETPCSDVGARKVSCDAGACVLQCQQGRADCDGKASTGCEATLASDQKNCGACGVSCGQRTCSKGLCEPERLARLTHAALAAASGEELAVWDQGAGQIQLLAPGTEPKVLWPTRAIVTGLALSKEVLVWAQDKPALVYALLREEKARPVRLAGPLPSASRLVLSADRSFVTFASGPKSIRTAAFDKTLVDGKSRETVCSAAPSAYAGNAQRQLCCAKGGTLSSYFCPDAGCEEKRYPLPCPTALVVDEEHAYLPQGVSIVKLAVESGEMKRWISRRGLVADVAVHGGWLYWAERERELWRAPLKAEIPRTEVQRVALGAEPASFFFGDSAVYWFEPETADAGKALSLFKNTLTSEP
jgi:hypothetical protein